tara:strand:+ start:743 stop:1276 length:534 start_codon:yes stop_codon:yes gene_type:complete
MRIIQGEHKNRRFAIPKNLKIRPTTDRAKESLFNILENMYDFENLEVLDLFSGSGNITYEFCSRGAIVTCVEINKKCTKYIFETSKKLGMKNTIYQKDVFRFLKTCKKKYNIIFADPPFNYSKDIYSKLIKIIFEQKIITSKGTVIIEHSSFLNFKEHESFIKSKKYGDINFSFLKI